MNQFGYEALTADSGEHALTLYHHLHRPIDLLITDVVAPGMSGPMLADKLSVEQPGLKVLFISGYDNTQVVQKYVVEKGHALLTKPFNLMQLKDRVAELISGGPRRTG